MFLQQYNEATSIQIILYMYTTFHKPTYFSDKAEKNSCLLSTANPCSAGPLTHVAVPCDLVARQYIWRNLCYGGFTD